MRKLVFLVLVALSLCNSAHAMEGVRQYLPTFLGGTLTPEQKVKEEFKKLLAQYVKENRAILKTQEDYDLYLDFAKNTIKGWKNWQNLTQTYPILNINTVLNNITTAEVQSILQNANPGTFEFRIDTQVKAGGRLLPQKFKSKKYDLYTAALQRIPAQQHNPTTFKILENALRKEHGYLFNVLDAFENEYDNRIKASELSLDEYQKVVAFDLKQLEAVRQQQPKAQQALTLMVQKGGPVTQALSQLKMIATEKVRSQVLQTLKEWVSKNPEELNTREDYYLYLVKAKSEIQADPAWQQKNQIDQSLNIALNQLSLKDQDVLAILKRKTEERPSYFARLTAMLPTLPKLPTILGGKKEAPETSEINTQVPLPQEFLDFKYAVYAESFAKGGDKTPGALMQQITQGEQPQQIGYQLQESIQKEHKYLVKVLKAYNKLDLMEGDYTSHVQGKINEFKDLVANKEKIKNILTDFENFKKQFIQQYGPDTVAKNITQYQNIYAKTTENYRRELSNILKEIRDPKTHEFTLKLIDPKFLEVTFIELSDDIMQASALDKQTIEEVKKQKPQVAIAKTDIANTIDALKRIENQMQDTLSGMKMAMETALRTVRAPETSYVRSALERIGILGKTQEQIAAEKAQAMSSALPTYLKYMKADLISLADQYEQLQKLLNSQTKQNTKLISYADQIAQKLEKDVTRIAVDEIEKIINNNTQQTNQLIQGTSGFMPRSQAKKYYQEQFNRLSAQLFTQGADLTAIGTDLASLLRNIETCLRENQIQHQIDFSQAIQALEEAKNNSTINQGMQALTAAIATLAQ